MQSFSLTFVLVVLFLQLFPLSISVSSPSTGPASDPGHIVATKYYENRRQSGREVPDTLDLADNAMLAIHAITNGMDPDLEHRLWFSIYFDRKPLCMRHHEPSEFDQAGKYLEGLTLLRIMTGSDLNRDREAALWRFVENHTKQDGLIYYHPENPGEEPANAYTQARALLARISGYELDPDPEAKKRIERTIDSMVERKMVRGFGFGPLLPAVRWFQLTKYPKAMELAVMDFEALKKGDLFAEDGSFGGHFHYHTGAAIGLLAYGLMTQDSALVERIRRAYEFARSKGTDYGYFPECLPPAPWVMLISNEGCCTADMTSLAATLSRAGVGDYWDDLDRYLRNQLIEIQLKRTDFIERIPAENKVSIPISEERGEKEVDDLTRFVGAFAGWAAPNDFAGPAHFWLQQCCLGNCPRGLYQGWENIVTAEPGKIRVNLLLNRSTPHLDLDSSLPYDGKVEILLKQPQTLEVRVPGWVDISHVESRVDSAQIETKVNGRYLVFPPLEAGARVTITFPIVTWEATYRLPGAPWTSKYSVVDEQAGSGMPLPRSIAETPADTIEKILTPVEYRAEFRANTLISIDPPGGIYPLYQRHDLSEDAPPRRKVDRHVAEKTVTNWY